MRIFISKIVTVVFLGAVFFVAPHFATASELFFRIASNPVITDTATIVEVYIDPQDTVLNTVEGVLHIKDRNNAVTSVVVETGGSMLTLWPVRPLYATSSKTIQFTGGTRKSFSTKALILRVRIFSNSPDAITLSLLHGSAYLADGKGTKDTLETHSITISLEKSKPNPINPSSADSIPPTFDSIEMGRDDDMYNGKKFIQVVTSDNKTGVDRVEITENGIVTEATNDTYVFQKQEEPEVLVTAYDKAGNSTSVKFPKKNANSIYITIGISALIFFFLIKKYIFRFRIKH